MPNISECTIYEKMARRRGQRKGYVFERSGYWLGTYRVDSTEIDEKTGKPKRERVTVTIAAAKGASGIGKRQADKIFQEEYLAPVNAANMRPSSGKPLAEFVHARFYPDYLPTLKTSGEIHYRYILDKHVLPILGPLRLREISVERVQALLTLKGKTLSPQTVVHIRNCISAVLKFARSMGWFYGEIPTTGVRLPEMEREERQAPTWEQVCDLAAELEKPIEHKRFAKMKAEREAERGLCATLLLFLALTGLRIGEAMGLRWSRVNLTSEPVQIGTEILPPYCVAVRENYVRGKYGTLKTKGSRRNVPIPEWFVSRLAALSRENVEMSAPVFGNSTGTAPVDQHNLAARVMKKAAKNLSLDWISWHCLRHYYASQADTVGLTLRERMDLLGHATADVTMQYTHAQFESIRKKLEATTIPAAKVEPPPVMVDPQQSTTVH